MTSTYADDRLLEVDRVFAEALQPCEQRRIQSHREVDDLGDVGASCDFYGGGVASQPLLGSLFAVVLGDPIITII
jgi:hypothetical protein